MDTNKIIVALDTSDLAKINNLLKALKHYTSIFKIGMQIFTRYGLDIVKRVQDHGYKVFLDLKFFDIPNTVSNAVYSAVENDIYMLTLHIMGGSEMIKMARDAKKEKKYPYLLGVTVLTSMVDENLLEIGIDKKIENFVPYLATLGKKAGIDGVISSPLEIETIRKSCGDDFLIVTPGIRKEKSNDDQKRVLTPKEALEKGANYLVIGRPILEAKNPVEYIENIFL